MPRIRVDAIDLYVEVRGAGFPILGIHGTPSSAVMWEAAAVTLSRHGRCITYDRRGFLRSAVSPPPEALDLDQHVADAAALLDALDAAPAIIIGRSTGGQIALEFARSHPDLVRALVLLEPAVFTIEPEAEAWAEALRERTRAAAATDSSLAAESIIRDALGDDTWDALPVELTTMFSATSAGVLAEIRGVGLDLSARPRRYTAEELATVAMPVLVVGAETSPEPVRRVAAALPGLLPSARAARVPGGHLIDPASPVVLEFIDEHLPR